MIDKIDEQSFYITFILSLTTFIILFWYKTRKDNKKKKEEKNEVLSE